MSKQDLIVLLSAERAVVSTGRAGKSQLVSRPRNPGADAAEEVDNLLASLPLKPGKITVLCSELWTGAVGLENEVLRRVEKRHLPQMLGYEVEPLSGINASEARTGLAPLPEEEGVPQFWVTQADEGQFASFAEAIEFNGGRLQALLHPAGLPMPLTPGVSATSGWCRLELFGDAALLVYRAGKSVAYRFYADGAALAYNTDQLEAIQQECGRDAFEVLSDSTAAATPSYIPGAHVVSLEDEATVAAWMQGWRRTLSGKGTVPKIMPERQPMAARTRRFVTAGMAAAVLILCVGHYQFTKISNAAKLIDLRDEIAAAQAPIEAQEQQQARLGELKSSLSETQNKQAELEQAIDAYCDTMESHRQRVPGLLKSLARSSDPQLLIQEIACDGEQLTIHGRCLEPHQAKALATRLARDLSTLGYSVELPMTKALSWEPNGGPHEFEIVVKDNNS